MAIWRATAGTVRPLFRALGGSGAALLALLWLMVAAHAAEAPRYIGSAACGGCHQAEAARWSGSHHALAWTTPSPETVAADFDGTVFRDGQMRAEFRIAGDGSYHVAVTEADGTSTDYRVHSVVGVEPLQQYLLETEPGRLQAFDVVWDTRDGTGWFHLYPGADLRPGDGLHWTGPFKNWNGRCAVCHATGYEKNFDPATRTFASRQAEIGVGCEACHGPGSAHRALAEAGAMAADGSGLTMSFADPAAIVGLCAGCHARRAAFTADSPVAGTPFADSYALALLRPGLYHADGQILDEVYVTGSFLQSKMHARGVTCLNCHDPHSATLRAVGNAVCTQCHGPAGNPRFATLRRAVYDSPEHHFHTPGTAGAQCRSCHMPEHVYMGNDWRADHSFRVPRPDLAAQTGAPDACTGCHDGRDAAWAAAEIAKRFPDSARRGPHYGTVLARARQDPEAAAADLAALAADDAVPAIVRATALSLLGETQSDAALAGRLATYLADRDALVRAAAVDVQRRAPPQEGVPRLLPLLADPARSVRLEAARALLDAPIARLPRAAAADLAAAMGEWRAALAANLDFPETHLQLGGMALVMRNVPAARAAFREAAALDPQRIDAWVMLARIAAATETAAAVQAVLREAAAHNPDDPTIRAMLAEAGGG